MPTIYLRLGSNLGDRREHLRRAIDALARRFTQTAVSSLYKTDPVGYTNQPLFLNIAWAGKTDDSPEVVFAAIKALEAELGRTPTFPNGPRVIDIDLLLYGTLVINTPNLTIPHPRMLDRAFVLLPLAEIAPDAIHPLAGARIDAFVDAVDTNGVQKVEDDTWPETPTPSGRGSG